MNADEPTLAAASRWLNLATVAVVTAIAVGIAAISAGLFDPQPIGHLQRLYTLNGARVADQNDRVHWLEQPHLTHDGSLRLTAALVGGELDSGYGLVLGQPNSHLLVAVAPTGYVTIQNHSARQDILLPWQTWPHVRQRLGQNEIWLDIRQDHLVTVRINRELLWEGRLPLAGPDVGLWLRSYGQPAQIQFAELA
ncbi:MAG: hypothetical protein R3300_10460, partial [Candidatus Promineifilaceae bacterium]|nr:hypothetical protein [Candidatus Promineifilaceae bacterium]